MSEKISSLPWTCIDAGDDDAYDIDVKEDGITFTIATMNRVDARFACRAVNSHDKLVKALEGLLDCISETRGTDASISVEIAYQALAAAKGE